MTKIQPGRLPSITHPVQRGGGAVTGYLEENKIISIFYAKLPSKKELVPNSLSVSLLSLDTNIEHEPSFVI